MNTRTKSRIGGLLAFLMLAVFAASCQDSTLYPNKHNNNNDDNNEPTLTLPEIYGIEWQLQSFEDLATGDITEVPDGQMLTLTFQKDGLGGAADCNGYGANYTTGNNNEISITDIVSTLAVCNIGSLDGQFLTGLENAASYKISNTALRLYNADESKIMHFGTNTTPIQLLDLELITFAASDPYSTAGASITGDMLSVPVQYSGGCEEHDFLLYGPTTIPTDDPTEIVVFLIHEDNDDACEAFISETLQFDLVSLKKRWQDAKGKTDGSITINIHDAHTGIVQQVIYSFGNSKNITTNELPPAWLTDTINGILNQPPGNPRVAIYEYEYNNATVYYRTAPCCDMFSDLYDANGVLLCHPDGGFSGLGNMQCPDFLTKRKNPKLIWKDSR